MSADIDFTPVVNTYWSQGAEYSSVSFREDKRTISMEVPRKWTCRGDATRLQFIPPDQNFAEGVVQAGPPMRATAFDAVAVKALEQEVLGSLPPGSQGATILSRQENTVLLYENSSYEFLVSYQVVGQTFQRNVTFVKGLDALLIFRFTAPKPVFDNLNRLFQRSVSSWRRVETEKTVAGQPLTVSP